MSAPEATGQEEELVQALVDELTRARQRGLDELDLDTGQRHPIEAPELEQLARTYTRDPRTARTPLIRRLLTDALDAWTADGYEAEADLVRFLFFGPPESKPGQRRPGRLLRQAMAHWGLAEDALDERRRASFQLFARYLLGFTAKTASASSPSVPPSRRHRRNRRLIGLALVLVAATTAVWLSLRSDGVDELSGRGSADGVDSAGVIFRFDGLGGGSPVINVYPYVDDSPAARVPNGTYASGDVVGVDCKLTGRTVRSDPTVGEQLRESDLWLRVLARGGETSYAALTYGRIDNAALATLPRCRILP